MAAIQDGTVAMVKEVSDDCGQQLVAKPEHCIWSAPYDRRIERTVAVRLEIGADGTPTRTFDVAEEDRDAAACAMALRYTRPATCTVRLHLARHASDVDSAGKYGPTIDCTGNLGVSAVCATSVGASPVP